MKSYKVSDSLWPYIRRSLIRGYYKYSLSTDENGQKYCTTNASSDAFHRIVQRAKCQKKSDETGLFWVTSKEANNLLLLNLLTKEAGVTAYQIIDDADGSRLIR